MSSSDIATVLPWVIKLVAVLGVLWVVNIPVFRGIDVMFYGSQEAANQARMENEQHAAEIRNAEESNVFRQIDSLVEDQRFYRSNYTGQTQPAEVIKGILFLLQFLLVAWAYFKVFH